MCYYYPTILYFMFHFTEFLITKYRTIQQCSFISKNETGRMMMIQSQQNISVLNLGNGERWKIKLHINVK
jgi:hypothetical protein